MEPVRQNRPPGAGCCHRAVTITVPLAALDPAARRPRRIDLRLAPREAEVLGRLADGLNLEHRRIGGGRHVESGADALRWLLGELAGG